MTALTAGAMSSRSRRASERARKQCEERGERQERPAESETPKKPGRRLSRPRAAPLSGQTTSAPPGSDRGEEPCSNKKTPKHFSRSKPWMTLINSPSNDADQQQDIFWDPHSPTSFKLENGKKKAAANKCTVDISDIVNRIAPKDNKPSSSDAAYLGIWIGEDAIPCTPVVARARTKMHRSRILHTEEELMKLAKQLDSNLVKQKDQNEQQLAHYEDEMSSERNAANKEDDSFLEDVSEANIAAVLKSVSQTSAPHISSQSSVDQDAETAFNLLFDSSTQKYSGRLSQPSSDVSASSVHEGLLFGKTSVGDIGHTNKEQFSEKPKKSEQSSLASEVSMNVLEGVRKCSEQSSSKEKDNDWPVSSSQDDFEDDWDNDLLEDDSFIMQVTQNPELIATPKHSIRYNKADQTNTHHLGTKVNATTSAFSASKINQYKFVPRKVDGGSEAKPSNLCSTEMTCGNTLQGNSRNTNDAKTSFGTRTSVPSKPQTNAGGQMSKNNVCNLVPATNSTLIKPSHKPCAPSVPLTRAANVNKDSVLHEEWDDPKFSDEVLDMFCESDSLWEGKEEDDDLMYQVCDDVERLTQAQESSQESPKTETPQLPSIACQILAKPGINASQQNKHRSLVAASSSFGSAKLNRGVSPASFSGNCSNVYHNGSLQKSNQNFSRSTSVPSGGGCKNSFLTTTQSPNPVTSVSVTCSITNKLAPSKYSFTRIKPSQVTAAHTAQPAARSWSSSSSLHPQSFGDSRNNRDTIVPSLLDTISKPQQPLLKRHLSESTIQSSKVFASEDKNKKCSMEEIEKKKREALARRQMKAQACSGDIAPT